MLYICFDPYLIGQIWAKQTPTFLLYDRSANSMWGGEVTEDMSKISQHRNIGTIKTYSKAATLYIMKNYSILMIDDDITWLSQVNIFSLV